MKAQHNAFYKIEDIVKNPDNPRIIKDADYKILYRSIKNFPAMMIARPIIIDENNMILGGNQRFEVCKDLGWKEVPIGKFTDWTEEQKQEFTIKDNTNVGQWDYDILANKFDQQQIIEWGMSVVTGWQQEYSPNFNPLTYSKDVTQEQIEKRAQELAKTISRTILTKSIMCPNCDYEFEVS